MSRPDTSPQRAIERLNDGTLPDPLGLGDPSVAIPGRRQEWAVDERRVMTDGYVMVKVSVDGNGATDRVYEHRLVMERLILDRPLKADESARHRNGDSLDNRPENLVLYRGARPADVQPAVVVHDGAPAPAPKKQQRRSPRRSQTYALIPIPRRPQVVRARSARDAEKGRGPVVAVPTSRIKPRKENR